MANYISSNCEGYKITYQKKYRLNISLTFHFITKIEKNEETVFDIADYPNEIQNVSTLFSQSIRISFFEMFSLNTILISFTLLLSILK